MTAGRAAACVCVEEEPEGQEEGQEDAVTEAQEGVTVTDVRVPKPQRNDTEKISIGFYYVGIYWQPWWLLFGVMATEAR